MSRTVRTTCMTLVAAFAAVTAGCLQLETSIKLHPDGSATVTERVQFSRELLNLSVSATQPDLRIESLLDKPAVLERMKQMGEGVTLVSHEVHDAPAAARESISVFKVADLKGFEYCSPFLGVYDYANNCKLKVNVSPSLANDWQGWYAGAVLVDFNVVNKTRPPSRDPNAPTPPGPTPAQLQMIRELRPVVRDMLSGMRINVEFESYAPVSCRGGWRGGSAKSKVVTLVDLSDKNMDQYSMPFLDNEEVMLELVNGQLTGPNLIAATKDFAGNWTLPVYRPHGSGRIWFAPSKALFDRFMAGQTLDFGERGGGKQQADFNRVGWREEREKKN